MKQPVDQALRSAAISELGTSFFLEAGAGTGKTRILVERVVEIVRRGAAEIQEVVVITFTEKAAGELRARVRDRLQESLDDAGDGNDVDDVDDVERQRYRAALRNLVSAHIETIHGFASSLLRDFPLHAGIDPGFHQLDEVGGEVDFRERWSDWIWSVAGSQLAAVERCLTLGMSLATVNEVAIILDRYRELASSPPTAAPVAATVVLQQLIALIDRADAIAPACHRADDRCLQQFRALRRAVGGVQYATLTAPPSRRGVALETTLHALQVAPRRLVGARANWASREQLERMRQLLGEARSRIEIYQTGLNEHALYDLTRALNDFVGQAADSRRREGRLNFDDLLIEARRLVVEHPEVREVLRRRIRYLLVDEFQDTDPLQAELMFLLADDGSGAAGSPPDWRRVRLTPGKLFVVGDPKQSIYRFRRADIDTYLAAREVFRRQPDAHARVDSVVQNFRSVPEITTWINTNFSSVMRSDREFPNAQPDYRAIDADRDAAGEPRVVLLYPRAPVADLALAELRADEALAVARLVTDLAGNDAWQLADDPTHPDRRRPVALRDICILVESRTAIELFTRALAALHVPYILDGGRAFFQRQEVRDLAAILRALDDPSDEVALVAALKSDAFCCSDVELLEYRNAGGRFSLFAADGDRDSAVDRALARLRVLYEAKAHLTLPALVERAMRESLLMEPLLAIDADRQRAANLKLIVERAVEFAANEVDALRPFVRWLVRRQIEGARETESQLSEIDEDVVRIMTIHSAKGLEFPVVILAKLSAWEGGARTRTVVDRTRAAIEFEVGSGQQRFRTPGFAAASHRESVYQQAEEARLTYVATTRARDLLVISAYQSNNNPGLFRHLDSVPSWVAAVDRELPQAPGEARIMLDGELAGRPRAAAARPQFPADLVELWQHRLQQRREQVRAGPRYLTPSRLTEDELKYPRETEPRDRSEEDRDQDVRDETERALGTAEGADGALFVGSSTARRRGALVHEVLYRCDLADPASAALWAQRLTANRGLPELAGEVAAYARRILESDGMRRVLAANRVLRELPLVWYDAERDTYIEGYADLAFEEPAGWVIADYKTDAGASAAGDSAGALIEHYRPQVEAYRRAVAATGIRVTECGLWLAATGELHLW